VALAVIVVALVMAVVVVMDYSAEAAAFGAFGSRYVRPQHSPTPIVPAVLLEGGLAQSHGRWWFWLVVVVAALAVIAAFVVAVLIS